MESTKQIIDRNVVKKFAFSTLTGIKKNPTPAQKTLECFLKTNQDAYILSPNLNRAPAMHMFGIADGHG
jgi:serine/threonine protein phosphatase PrpC